MGLDILRDWEYYVPGGNNHTDTPGDAQMREPKRTGKTNWHTPERCPGKAKLHPLTRVVAYVILFWYVESFTFELIYRIAGY